MNQLNIIVLSHPVDDHAFLAEILEPIRLLKFNYNISIFSNFSVEINKDRDNYIKEKLKISDIIIPLISPEFLADELQSLEKYIKSLKKSGKFVHLIPFILRPCSWNDIDWMKEWKSYPTTGVEYSTINSENRNDQLLGVQTDILKILEFKAKKKLENKETGFTVFISHSHEDGDFADLLKLMLNKLGFKTWIDIDNIFVGDDWEQSIDFAIDSSDAVIVIMSPSSFESKYVIYEWSYALGRKKLVFPIKFKSSDVHPKLSRKQLKDFTVRGQRPWNELASTIIRRLEESLAKKS